MTTIQVTLNIDDSIADRIKRYAEDQHITLDMLLEQQLKTFADSQPDVSSDTVVYIKKEPHEFSPWLQSVILAKEPTPDFDHKAEYGKHLEEKYDSK